MQAPPPAPISGNESDITEPSHKLLRSQTALKSGTVLPKICVICLKSKTITNRINRKRVLERLADIQTIEASKLLTVDTILTAARLCCSMPTAKFSYSYTIFYLCSRSHNF